MDVTQDAEECFVNQLSASLVQTQLLPQEDQVAPKHATSPDAMDLTDYYNDPRQFAQVAPPQEPAAPFDPFSNPNYNQDFDQAWSPDPE